MSKLKCILAKGFEIKYLNLLKYFLDLQDQGKWYLSCYKDEPWTYYDWV